MKSPLQSPAALRCATRCDALIQQRQSEPRAAHGGCSTPVPMRRGAAGVMTMYEVQWLADARHRLHLVVLVHIYPHPGRPIVHRYSAALHAASFSVGHRQLTDRRRNVMDYRLLTSCRHTLAPVMSAKHMLLQHSTQARLGPPTCLPRCVVRSASASASVARQVVNLTSIQATG